MNQALLTTISTATAREHNDGVASSATRIKVQATLSLGQTSEEEEKARPGDDLQEN